MALLWPHHKPKMHRAASPACEITPQYPVSTFPRSRSQGHRRKPAHAHNKIQSLSACSFNPVGTHQAFLSPLIQPCHHWHTHTRAEWQTHSRLPNWINVLNRDKCLSRYWCHHDPLRSHESHMGLRLASCQRPMAEQAAHVHTHANMRQNSLTQGSYSGTAQCHPHLLHVAPLLGGLGTCMADGGPGHYMPGPHSCWLSVHSASTSFCFQCHDLPKSAAWPHLSPEPRKSCGSISIVKCLQVLMSPLWEEAQAGGVAWQHGKPVDHVCKKHILRQPS